MVSFRLYLSSGISTSWLTCFRTVTVIHSENVLLENIYVNSTDTKQDVGFDFSSLNVSCYIVSYPWRKFDRSD